jgi:hypothetical protein
VGLFYVSEGTAKDFFLSSPLEGLMSASGTQRQIPCATKKVSLYSLEKKLAEASWRGRREGEEAV